MATVSHQISHFPTSKRICRSLISKLTHIHHEISVSNQNSLSPARKTMSPISRSVVNQAMARPDQLLAPRFSLDFFWMFYSARFIETSLWVTRISFTCCSPFVEQIFLAAAQTWAQRERESRWGRAPGPDE